jgi:2-succinyl-5-enolpyruvyl-6-hydroxy-3-cyclohexene-1-carboxylate synthase
VHLNLPFRKPLEPARVAGDVPANLWDPSQGFVQIRPASEPYTVVSRGQVLASDAQVESLARAIQQAERGIIYCGPRCPGGGSAQAILKLSQVTGFPIFADALSGLRFHPGANKGSHRILGGYETFLKSPALRNLASPDLVFQFGAVPTSKSLSDFLSGLKSTRRIQIDGNGAWSDDAFVTTDYLWADPELTLQAVLTRVATAGRFAADPAWQAQWMRAERLTWQAFDQTRQSGFFEGALLADILDQLSAEDSLFVASSLPVRHLDQFCRPSQIPLHVYANRGASGIDGTIASALGVAATFPERRMTLVIGDLAFYHDLNSLLLLHKQHLKVIIILINNDGGGIFQRLPIANFEPLFSQLFLASHGLKFEHAARLFQLDYQFLPSGESFRTAFHAALANDSPQILEVSADVAANERARQAILQGFEQLWYSNLK